MALRKRKHLSVVNEFDDAADTQGDPGADGDWPDMTASVGSVLKQARERAGYSLPEVAATVRIRLVLLEAIEEGRFRDLPGPVYAIGFIRTYAALFQLDSDRLVANFKEEATGAEKKPELVFPAPVPEGRIPGGAILMIALLVIGLTYAGWYYASSANREFADFIPSLPERFAALLSSEEEVAPAPPPSVEPAAAPPSVAALSQPGPAERMVPGPVVPGPTARVLPALAALATAEFETQGDPAPAPALAEAAAPAVPAAETPDLAVPAASPPLGSAAASEGPPPPVARILLRATSDSWVEVRDSAGGLVLARLLTSGATYEVPDLPGLKLKTGNAGGLAVEVDGQATPMLGGQGEVVRNVVLDADLLKSGAAIQRH